MRRVLTSDLYASDPDTPPAQPNETATTDIFFFFFSGFNIPQFIFTFS